MQGLNIVLHCFDCWLQVVVVFDNHVTNYGDSSQGFKEKTLNSLEPQSKLYDHSINNRTCLHILMVNNNKHKIKIIK